MAPTSYNVARLHTIHPRSPKFTFVWRRKGRCDCGFKTAVRHGCNHHMFQYVAEGLKSKAKSFDLQDTHVGHPMYLQSICTVILHVVRPKQLTLMVLVGARTTFSARTNFFLFQKKI